MSLVPKEILLSHLQRAEGAEEVTLPIDFFRDLLYQAMPSAWVDLTDEDIDITISAVSFAGPRQFARAIERKLKEKNT